jgi:nucleotide-binding universal stress UspA family protein
MRVLGTEIIVGFDGSDHARTALDFAAKEALNRRLPIRLVQAFTPPMGGAGLGYGTVLPADALDTMRDAIAGQLQEAADEYHALFPDLQISTTVVVGNSTAALMEEAKDAALLVVGSRGLGGFRGLLLGSTGVQVAAHARCPVAVVRGTAQASANTVVVGLDGSDLSQSALEWAFDFASRHGHRLLALHAWTVPSFDLLATPAGPGPADISELTDEEMRSTAESLAGFRTDYPDVSVDEVVIKESPIKALLAHSDEAVAIVVGTHGRGEVMGAVLGSVSQGVLHKAKIPVVVVGLSDVEDPGGLGTRT